MDFESTRGSATAESNPWWQVEDNHINVVEDADRHGQSRSLFYVWFAANLSIATLITGALAVIVGNNLFWGVLAVIVGNAAGSIFVAAHSAQGPKLGVPQLIQSRGQFGFYGALLPVVLALVVYVGFFAFGTVPAAEGLGELSSDISTSTGLLLIGVPSLIIAILGYRVIHWTQKVTTYGALVALIVLTVAMFGRGGLDWSTSAFNAGPWLLAVAIIAVYQISYSTYVSDYSRYLPASSGYKAPFWWTYVGTTVSGIWVMGLGAIITTQYPDDGPVQAVSKVAGEAKPFVQLILALAAIGISAMNLYGGMLSIVTGISSVRDVGRGVMLRIVSIFVIFAAGLTLALATSDDFFTNFQNFLLALVYIFIPWTAVNLTDFYLVRRGHYDVAAFFDRKGLYFHDPATRTFGGFSLYAFAAYCLGFLAEIPFINTTYWKGWAVDSLDGADVAWVVGLLVTSVMYLALTRGMRRKVTT